MIVKKRKICFVFLIDMSSTHAYVSRQSFEAIDTFEAGDFASNGECRNCEGY